MMEEVSSAMLRIVLSDLAVQHNSMGNGLIQAEGGGFIQLHAA